MSWALRLRAVRYAQCEREPVNPIVLSIARAGMLNFQTNPGAVNVTLLHPAPQLPQNPHPTRLRAFFFA
jgi:hypothetical protein